MRLKRYAYVSDDEHWIPLADLMTGLMFLFLLIAITYMVQVEQQAAKAKRIAVLYEQTRLDLYQDLRHLFGPDLKRWHAELKSDLSLRFTEPTVQFATGSADLRPTFTTILNEFFPRYVKLLDSPKYRNDISEVRIEGHTSSFWAPNTAPQLAYFENMRLSQDRTRSVLTYVMSLYSSRLFEQWLRSKVTANGLSSSRLIYKNGKEDSL